MPVVRQVACHLVWLSNKLNDDDASIEQNARLAMKTGKSFLGNPIMMFVYIYILFHAQLSFFFAECQAYSEASRTMEMASKVRKEKATQP